MSRLSHFGKSLALAAALALASPAAAQLFADDAARQSAAQNSAAVEDLRRALAQVNQNAEKALAETQAIRRQFSAAQTKIQELEASNRALQGGLDETKYAAQTSQTAANAAAETITRLLTEFRAQTEKLRAAEASIERLTAQVAALESRAIERDAQLAEQAELAANLMHQIGELSQFAEIPPEQDLYEEASALFQKRDYEKALASFRRVLRLYPNGRFSEGAKYWESAALYFLGRNEEAAREAQTLVRNNPNSDKRPDAELILARALNAMGSPDEARTVLEGIIANDPASLAADKARQLLADIAPANPPEQEAPPGE